MSAACRMACLAPGCGLRSGRNSGRIPNYPRLLHKHADSHGRDVARIRMSRPMKSAREDALRQAHLKGVSRA